MEGYDDEHIRSFQFDFCARCNRILELESNGMCKRCNDEVQKEEVFIMDKKVRLNLGCGTDIKDGWDHYDMFPCDDRVKYIDLYNIPLPFPDSYADEVKLSHIVEHLVYRKEFMYEMSRILKPDGICHVFMPTFNFCIDHKRCMHTPDSMVTVCSGLVENDRLRNKTPQPFKIVRASYGCAKPLVFFKNLKILFDMMLYGNVQWEMQNDKDNKENNKIKVDGK